jgi:uncharacterized protein YodC (DUF2158 family)
MAQFNKGDVVMLKSGGERMTVEDVGDYSQGMGMGPEDGVHCVWFEGKKVQSHTFDAATLTLA